MAKINLNSILADDKNAVEKIVETVEVAQQPLPNFDAILMEWSWRCEKGYPDFNNKKDMLALKEVLKEMDLPIPDSLIIEAKNEVVPGYPKALTDELKSANKLEQFIEFVNTLPGGEAPETVAVGISRICNTKSNITKLVKIFKNSENLEGKDGLESINPNDGIYSLLYKVQPNGTGPGEILISWCINGATVQGGNVSYDINFNGEHWEVKSLISTTGNTPEPIDPAKYGKINNFKFSRELQLFFETIIDPYYDNKLRDSVLEIIDDTTIKNELNKILNIIETMPRTTANGSGLLSASIGEMTPALFNKFYEGISEIKKLLPSSIKVAAKASRIYVKSDTTDSQYWIEPDDIEDITKNAGKDTEISIKVGTKITDENKEAKIWLANLSSNKFITNPEYFINTLRSIRDNFGLNKKGIIYLTKGKFNISTGMEKFFTSGITRSTYRFSLKDQNKFASYNYAKEQ